MTPDACPLESLLLGLEVDSQGRFTLHADRAQALAEKFRLPAPSYFMLHAVGAVVASGASRVDIRLRPAHFSLQWDGPEINPQDLADSHHSLWSSDRAVARWRELAVASEGARAWGGPLQLVAGGLQVERTGWMNRLRSNLSRSNHNEDLRIVRDYLVSSESCTVQVNGEPLPGIPLPPLAAAARLGDVAVQCESPVWEPDFAWLDDELLLGARGVVGRLLPGHASPAHSGPRHAWPGYLDLVVHARLYRCPLPARWRNCWGILWLRDIRRDLSLSSIAPAEMKNILRLVDGCLSAL